MSYKLTNGPKRDKNQTKSTLVIGTILVFATSFLLAPLLAGDTSVGSTKFFDINALIIEPLVLLSMGFLSLIMFISISSFIEGNGAWLSALFLGNSIGLSLFTHLVFATGALNLVASLIPESFELRDWLLFALAVLCYFLIIVAIAVVTSKIRQRRQQGQEPT